MKFLNLKRILCLSAHPDDVEYGVMGSMAVYGETQFDVLVLSSGGDFDKTTGQDRINECKKVWDWFENVNGEFSGHSYVKDSSEDFWVNHIETKCDVKSYDAILTLPNQDSHFEHRMVNKVSYALLRGIDVGLITYRTPSTLEGWIPNYYVDVNSVIQNKIGILRESFVSQKDKLYFQEKSIRDFHTNYLCSKVGVGYVEQFRVERLFG
tara:strand:- start:3841 stop:4467 length:627 start_codon:yes stop_codon:yes gene_type:complete